MNILQILPRMDVGGVETGVLDLSCELVKKGHRVVVVSNGGRMVRQLSNLNIKHITLPVHKKSLWTVLKMIRELKPIIERENIDIVHARSRVPAIIAFFATRETKANFITTAHGYYSVHPLSRIMGWGKFVIVASTVIGHHMIEDFGVPPERIRFIPRGVDLEKFKFAPKDTKTEYKIGIVGRITPIKGHTFLLQAIARVVKIFPKVKVLIVGDAPNEKPEYRTNIESLIKKLKIERFVEFLGCRDDIPKIMSEIDILVFPSVGQEAFGRSIIEAGASGVPVIATRIGGVIDIIEDELTGLLVNPNDIMGLVNAMIKLLTDREFAKRLAIEARKKIEKDYSLDRMAEETLKLYEEVCRRKRILVIKISALGDVILAVPSIRAIRDSLPNAFITLLVGSSARGVFKKCPYIDDIILYDSSQKDNGILGILKISAIVRSKAFDMSIDLQNNRKSHIIAWLGAIPKRYGYCNKKFGSLVNNGLKYLKINAGPIEEQFRILKESGIETVGISKHLEIWPSKEDSSYIDNFLKNEWVRENEILIGFNIGGSWQTKRWHLDNFVKLADMFAENNIRVVVTGSREEKDLAQSFVNMTKNKIVNASGKTNVTQLAVLIKRCKVFITGDSAPMHIASSMGTNFVALFGPTDSRRHFEPTEKGVVVQKGLSCSPCYKPYCKKLICMKRIGVDEVFRLVMERI